MPIMLYISFIAASFAAVHYAQEAMIDVMMSAFDDKRG